MSSSWSKIVVPESKNLEEIMFEEVKHNFEEKRKNQQCILTLSTMKSRPADLDDEQLAKILQGEDSDQNISGNDDSDVEDVENVDDAMYWEKFDSILKDFDPIPLYNSRSKHDVTPNTEVVNICGTGFKTSVVLATFMRKGIFDKINGVMARGMQCIIIFFRKILILDFI